MSAAACAQFGAPQPAPVPSRAPDAGAFTASVVDNALTLVDDRTQRAIVTPNGQPFWQAGSHNAISYVRPQIDFVKRAGGADLVVRFLNEAEGPRRLGTLYVGGIRMGAQIEKRRFVADAKPVTVDHEGKSYFGGGDWYPNGLYAPVATLREGDVTVGVSVHYPILEYEHPVFIRVESPGGQYTKGGRNWQVMIQLGPEGGARIAPGETRTYVVSVRAATGDPEHDWLRTLRPYRDYFRSLYGGVTYQRDPRPVAACEIAGTSSPTPDNPRAFAYEDRRIDRWGWQPWIDVMRAQRREGFGRFMLVAPTGLYQVNRSNNYPFQFTSGWRDVEKARTDLPRLATLGSELGEGGLGLWWGRSAQVMRSWDTPRAEILDPDDETHRELAFRELNLAALLNVRVIGLDAFTEMPAWDGYRWLKQMRERYPDFKFIAEPLAPDFIHTLAGTYVYGLRFDAVRDREPDGPFRMADFLVPGHETWARLSDGAMRRRHHVSRTEPLPTGLVRMHAQRLAAWGYIPIIHAPCKDIGDVRAARTWTASIPPDLREFSPADDPDQ